MDPKRGNGSESSSLRPEFCSAAQTNRQGFTKIVWWVGGGGLWGGSGVEASRMPSRMPYPSPIAIFFRFNGIDQHRFTAAGSADRAHDAAKEHKKDEEPS